MKYSQMIRSLPIFLITVGASVGCATTDTSQRQALTQQHVKACVDEFFKNRTPFIKAQEAYNIHAEIRQDCRRQAQRHMTALAERGNNDGVNALAQAEVKETRSE